MRHPTLNRLKRIVLLLLMMSPTSLLSGCWDRVEINDVAYVLTTAIDKEQNGQYRVTVQVALPGQMGGISGGGGGTSGDKSYYVDSVIGNTLSDIINLQRRMSRIIAFSHRRVLVIGEEVAREGVAALFDSIARVPANRLTAYIVVAEGKGYDLLNAQPQFERFSAEAMRELAKTQSINEINMKTVAQALNQSGSDPIMTYMSVQKSEGSKQTSEEIGVLGYAQFRGDRMVGAFKDQSFIGISWLRNDIKPYVETISRGEGATSLLIQDGKLKLTPIIEADHLRFHAEVQANAAVLESLSNRDLLLPNNIVLLEKQLENAIKKSIQAAIKNIQVNQADSADLGLSVWHHYPRQWKEKYEQNWSETLKEIPITVHIQATVSHVGLISENIAQEGR